jgi:hypothetical protein
VDETYNTSSRLRVAVPGLAGQQHKGSSRAASGSVADKDLRCCTKLDGIACREKQIVSSRSHVGGWMEVFADADSA